MKHKHFQNIRYSPCKKLPNAPTSDKDQDNNYLGTDTLFTSAMVGVTPLPKKSVHRISPQRKSKASIALNPASSTIFVVNKYEDIIDGYVEDLDNHTFMQLKHGHYRPQARLNLHGFTLHNAFYALVKFFHLAYTLEHQVVLVIPGQGKHSPEGHSILKMKLSEWFVQKPFSQVILAFCTAKNHDGGTGSLYVLLKNDKSQEKISWCTKPLDPDILSFF